ncbi:MAG: NosD domain-containing protein [Promethearchaeota archaeon]
MNKTHISLKFIFIILVVSIFIFIFPSINYIVKDDREDQKYLLSKTWDLSGTVIHINNNWSATAFKYEWCSGNGTINNPYLLENITIDALGNVACIIIENSDDFFIIQRCTLYNSLYNLLIDETYNDGIKLINVDNGLIKNNNFSSNGYGLYMGGGYYNTISHNNFNDNTYGIGMDNCYNSTVSDNQLIKNYFYGITLSDCDYNIISNNTATHSFYGIRAWWCRENKILFNNLSQHQITGLELSQCFNSLIINNLLNYNNEQGIFVELSNGNNISKNHCNNNLKYGICLNGSDFSEGIANKDNQISENIIHNNSWGIFLKYSSNNEISNNSIKKNQYSGIYADNSDYLNISWNIINENHYGINISECIWCIIELNTINNNYYGIFLRDSHKNIIFKNTLLNNKKCFVESEDCIDNTFEDNICKELENPNIWIIPTIIISVSSVGLIGTIWLIMRKLRK